MSLTNDREVVQNEILQTDECHKLLQRKSVVYTATFKLRLACTGFYRPKFLFRGADSLTANRRVVTEETSFDRLIFGI